MNIPFINLSSPSFLLPYTYNIPIYLSLLLFLTKNKILSQSSVLLLVLEFHIGKRTEMGKQLVTSTYPEQYMHWAECIL
jgi:hypothetical protein